jgi:cytidyltransferase-like protein
MLPARLAEALEAWHKEHRRISLVTGAFHILHPEHLRLLERARAQADVLIVAVVDDESLRGTTGSVMPPEERAEILRSLAIVDEAGVIPADGMASWLAHIRPHVAIDASGPDRSTVSILARIRGGDR